MYKITWFWVRDHGIGPASSCGPEAAIGRARDGATGRRSDHESSLMALVPARVRGRKLEPEPFRSPQGGTEGLRAPLTRGPRRPGGRPSRAAAGDGDARGGGHYPRTDRSCRGGEGSLAAHPYGERVTTRLARLPRALATALRPAPTSQPPPG